MSISLSNLIDTLSEKRYQKNMIIVRVILNMKRFWEFLVDSCLNCEKHEIKFNEKLKDKLENAFEFYRGDINKFVLQLH